MEYERIQKRAPAQANQLSLSPGKLRAMMMGAEKKRAQEDEEHESARFSMRSQVPEISHFGGDSYESCKDVDVVSVLPEFPTVSTPESSSNSNSLANSRVRLTDDNSMHYDSGNDATSVSSSAFEFHKAERAQQRVPPFSKPTPSKWDDAQKWIASPTANLSKIGQASQGAGSRKAGYFGYLTRQPSAKVVVEVTDQRMGEPDTKMIDSSHDKMESGMQKVMNWDDAYQCTSESYSKPDLMMESLAGESAMNFSRHDSSLAVHTGTTMIPPPSTARSVSMRDMGTEMTPIASQEPSRTGTPVRATTPTRSPTTSRPSTPGRVSSPNEPLDPNTKEWSEKELQMKTRREIMALGTQLGKMNIAAWASKDDENREASASIKTVASQPSQSFTETRAVAWEEAEKAKYMARFKRDEIKIQAWENHQKAKTEAEMRKTEVEVERMRSRAQEKLMKKLASVQHRAEKKLAVAEAKRNQRAAKTEQQAEYIRKTGRIPSSFSCCNWCH